MAISHTESFLRYKNNTQELLDSVVLMAHAVPALKGYMKAVEKGSAPKLPDPDHFGKPQPSERLREHAKGYKGVLGKMILISTHGYFEAYCKGMFDELVAFHGGETSFAQMAAVHQDRRSAASGTRSIAESLAKLREYPKPAKIDKYRKHRALTVATGFPMPSERFSAFGVRSFSRDARNATAAQLPTLLREALGVPLSDRMCEDYKKRNSERNRAAHGDLAEFSFRDAIAANRMFREIAITSDKFVVENFLLVDP